MHDQYGVLPSHLVGGAGYRMFYQFSIFWERRVIFSPTFLREMPQIQKECRPLGIPYASGLVYEECDYSTVCPGNAKKSARKSGFLWDDEGFGEASTDYFVFAICNPQFL